jgi:tripartite-type tricarboxylate transporter receptor subunit TctC
MPFSNTFCSRIFAGARVARSLVVAAVASAGLVGAQTSLASQTSPASQTFPDHPVKIIVPFAPGGAYDIIGRLLAGKLSERTGQPFVVENRPGAGSMVGTQSAAAAPPDGYTLVVGGLSNLVFNFALYQQVPYEPKDFVPVGLVYTFPYVLVARPDLPGDLLEIIAVARQRPGALTVAHPGIGSGQQIIAAAFMRLTGTALDEVMDNTQAVYPALKAGRVDLFFDSATAALPFIESHQVRGIALMAPRRCRRLPQLPTMLEAGLSGLGVESWIGLFAPAQTPPEVLTRLRDATRLAAADLKGPFEDTGGSLMDMPIGDADQFLQSEYDLWTRVIRDAGIRRSDDFRAP